jgi:uncharacterized protein (TIGR02145 family)
MIKKFTIYPAIIIFAGLMILASGCDKDETREPLKDIDGNIYETVTLFTQEWMAEDLKTTKLNDGSPITYISENQDWSNLITPGYCLYNNDQTNKFVYGALYNWYTVNSQKLCPEGWHVPTQADFTTMINNLGGNDLAGGKLKESSTSHWLTPNQGATNSYGFTSLPGGFRETDGSFSSTTLMSGYWSSTPSGDTFARTMELYYDSNSANNGEVNLKKGFAVRCVKD